MSPIPNQETWIVRKPAVESQGGIVASQHRAASAIGAAVLARGGNAVDAAVATGLAIGGVEPWMSGIGGGGFFLVYLASEDRCYCVDSGMIAPRGLNPDNYPLSNYSAADLFGWPGVQGDRNIHGYHSIAVPGHVAGMAKMLERFGTISWGDAIEPAIDVAESGMSVDWYGGLMIAGAAEILKLYETSATTYLPNGLAPIPDWTGEPVKLRLGNLAKTLRRLQEAGPRDFYEGEIAEALVRDANAGGSALSAADLAGYDVQIVDAENFNYRDAKVHIAPGLTAGPTLRATLDILASEMAPRAEPNADTYRSYASALLRAYEDRLQNLGDADESRAPSCTTHFSVVDRDGNMVAVTQTLLSLFGSRVMLPETGILMNNGIMWFDPRPDRANSLAPGKRPLSNMCPVVLQRANGDRFALGASGGRRIMPAVMQLASFLSDFNMSLDDAMHQPRIDVSGTDVVTIDRRLDDVTQAALTTNFTTRLVQHGVYPPLFACPNVVGTAAGDNRKLAASYIMSPWSKAVQEEE
jgi:gamma-glutamyltranspeptidase/glutathione hydrolase